MKPVERSELLSLGDYEQIRPRFRARIIAEKRHRRLSVGPRMSVVFENRHTVMMQIHEMLRTERITNDKAIAHELSTYNQLVPGADQLSMTLFIEVSDAAEREALLAACAGMESHVYLELDDQRIAAVAAERDVTETDRTTAVQYYMITLGEAADALRQQRVSRASIVVEHPGYQARAEMPDEVVTQLIGDLTWSS